jgi:peptide/nickel transport system substrate-binding protein
MSPTCQSFFDYQHFVAEKRLLFSNCRCFIANELKFFTGKMTGMRKILFSLQHRPNCHLGYGLLLLLATLSCNSQHPKEAEASQSVVCRLSSEPEKLSPFTSADAVTQQLLSNLFQKLTDFDPITLEKKPVLVKKVPQIVKVDTGKWKGGISLTYEMNDSARWDNGTPITAADYMFSLKIILNPYVNAGLWRAYLDNLLCDVQLYPENPKKWTVFMRRPYINAESVIGEILILPAHFYDKNNLLGSYAIAPLADTAQVKKLMADSISNKSLKEFARLYHSPTFFAAQQGISGSSAYTLSEWLPNQNLTFQHKTNWWASRDSNKMLSACPQKLTYRVVKEDATALAMLKNGGFDVCARIPSNEFLGLKKNEKLNKTYDFNSFPLFTVASVGFNLKNPKLTDKKVRRAIALTFDTESIIKNLMDGFGDPVVGPISPEKAYYNTSLKPLSLDLEEAKKLLEEAGWKDSDKDGILDKVVNGQKTPLVLHYAYANVGAMSRNVGLLLKENAQKVGISIELDGVDADILKGKLKKRSFDLILKPIASQYGLDDMRQLWHTSSDKPGGNNYFGFGNAHSDALIEQIQSELDPEKRRKLYWQFQNLLYEEQPAVFLFAVRERLAIHKRFHAEVCKQSPGFVPRFLCQ